MSKIHNKSCDQFSRDKTTRRNTTVDKYNNDSIFFVSHLQGKFEMLQFFFSSFDKVLFVGLFVFVKYTH